MRAASAVSVDSRFEVVGSWLSLYLSRPFEEPQLSAAESKRELGQERGMGQALISPSSKAHTSIHVFI